MQKQFAQGGFSLIELMIALSLGALLCVGIFNLFDTMQRLHKKQMMFSTAQEKMRFITQFMREKIQVAGNWSCLLQSKAPRSIVIRQFDSDDALKKLGLTIKTGTDLLQLHECVRLHDKQGYFPIEFFIADTFRADTSKKEIEALFYKVDHHPREELITGMTDFKVHIYHLSRAKEKSGAVRIDFVLSSAQDDSFSQAGVLYVARRIALK
jgi:prepilin-type N-terminal cleavage/methylation domain-containing protein